MPVQSEEKFPSIKCLSPNDGRPCLPDLISFEIFPDRSAKLSTPHCASTKQVFSILDFPP